MIALALWGCPRPPPVEAAAPEVGAAVDSAPVTTRSAVAGPDRWTEPGGLSLDIPAGWAGTAGPPPLVLSLRHLDTGVGLELVVVAAGEPLPERPGFDLWFEDAGGYRSVPVLGATAGTRSWLSTDPGGPTAQSWYGPVGERTLELVAIYRRDRSTEGEKLVTPLLHAIGELADSVSGEP